MANKSAPSKGYPNPPKKSKPPKGDNGSGNELWSPGGWPKKKKK